ncbi:MAG TPA: esterase YqiA, partial [Gammaproteobacteria bacterium]|nr:esterase YqiA [Gammaproteobacteria bacterium]
MTIPWKRTTAAEAINGLMSAPATVLYLHGFLSSPQSKKAQQTLRYCKQRGMGENVLIPQMRHGPAQTMAELKVIVEAQDSRRLVLIGSSLGGFYATYLAEEYGFPAVLINPAVRPFELWQEHLGQHRNYYTDEIHTVTKKHIEELKKLDRSQLQYPRNIMVLLQSGDEVLDYTQAREKFNSSRCIVRENGSHSFEDFAAELPAIFDFL